jgi:hypothetical protein
MCCTNECVSSGIVRPHLSSPRRSVDDVAVAVRAD